MSLRKAILSLIAVILTVAASGWAQSTDAPSRPETGRFGDPTGIARKYQNYLYGVIKKIGKDEIILEKTRFGIDTAIKLLPKTRYVYNEKPSTLKELKVGDQVYVDVKTDKKTGDMSAKKIVSGMLGAS
jgi:hypothetical protein